MKHRLLNKRDELSNITERLLIVSGENGPLDPLAFSAFGLAGGQ